MSRQECSILNAVRGTPFVTGLAVMRVTGAQCKPLRAFGLIWIVLAPVVFSMAAISTVKSDATYVVQFAAFSSVAAAAAFFGVAAVLRRSWSAAGLQVL